MGGGRDNGRSRAVVTVTPVFTSRLQGRQLLDSDGLAIGRIRDVVILPTAGSEPPWVLGLAVTLQRRQIFVNLGRVAEISVDGAHLRGGTVDLRRFTRRTGEILASELYGRSADSGTVLDVGIAPSDHRRGGWEVSVLAISQGRTLRHRSPVIVPWDKYPELFKAGRPGRAARHAARDAPDRPGDRGRGHVPQPPRPAGRRAPGRGAGRRAGGDARAGPDPVPGRAGPGAHAPTSSRRWSPTTPPTCWPRCPTSSGSGCWRRWRRARPPTSGGCCATARRPPAA